MKTTVLGWKFPLLEIRQKLFQKQKKLMRLHADDEIDTMSREEISDVLLKCKSFSTVNITSMDIIELRDIIKKVEWSRTLWMWHDHSTVLSYGLVLVMVGVTYDPLTFYTDEEVPNSFNRMSLQEFIEQSEIHIPAHCSSISSDRAGLIPERVACLESLSVPIITENGITLKDRLAFFKGDKHSAWFEAGIMRGGITAEWPVHAIHHTLLTFPMYSVAKKGHSVIYRQWL